MAELLIVQSHSAHYSPRTWHNARTARLTVAFAVNFATAGERLTAKAAGERYVAIDLAMAALDAARLLWRHWAPHAGQTLNVAGNGIHSLTMAGWTAEQANRYVFEVLAKVHAHAPFGRVVSGGQTGIDLAGGIAGFLLGVDVCLTLPKGFRQRDADGQDRQHTRDEIETQIRDGASILSRLTPPG